MEPASYEIIPKLAPPSVCVMYDLCILLCCDVYGQDVFWRGEEEAHRSDHPSGGEPSGGPSPSRQ